MLKVDLHIHTKYSFDSKSSIEEIIEKAIERKLDAVAITDHNSYEGCLQIKQIELPKNLIIIPGIELRTKEGDILLLNTMHRFEKGLSLFKVLEVAQKFRIITIAPHPFAITQPGIKDFIKLEEINAVEVINGGDFFGRANYKALKAAQGYKKIGIACSDAHSADDVGNVYTLVEAERSIDSILSSIIGGKIKIPEQFLPSKFWSLF